MKAITLYQPYATLMAIGAKTFETRSWKTNYTGQIAVHAAKTFPAWCKDLFRTEPFHSMLVQYGHETLESLPRGVILSIHVLKRCYATPMVAGQTKLYTRGARALDKEIRIPPPWPESACGDYGPGRYAWHMPLIERLEPPQAARGKQGLWNWPRT